MAKKEVSKIEIICREGEADINITGDQEVLVATLAAIMADTSKDNVLRGMFTTAVQLILMMEFEEKKKTKKSNPKMANGKASDKPFTKTRKKNGKAA